MSSYYCQNCGRKAPKLYINRAENFRKNCRDIKDGDIYVCQICRDCFDKSEESLEDILSSDNTKKLVLGGPGTGKSYLFKKYCRKLTKESNILVITFINNLVKDLERQLSDITDREIKVRTLHSFCKNFLLQNIHPFEYFPELPKIIENDAHLTELSYKEKNANRELTNLIREGSEINFYLSRSDYYNSVSHDDAVYRVFNYLCENNELIPQYTQVIVDEYQDFNLLEASLIELLAKKNMILVAGDDDQALYRFKSASPEFIRNLYGEEQFKHFFLPFCRRCPSVLIKATNAFISKAKEKGLLTNRIEKEFKCYWPDKFIDSNKNPLIFLGKFTTDSVVSKYVKEKILSIIRKEKIQPSKKLEAEFLIIGPPRRTHYLRDVNASLVEDERFKQDIFEIEYKKEQKKLSINEGYEFIKKDAKSNLGWRIIMYKDPIDPTSKIDKEIIHKSLNGESIIDLLPEEYINKHKERANKISKEEVESLEDSSDEKIKIKLTTYLGAKGLSANHVFVLGLENGILPKNPHDISDDEVCQFIVLLTRARKSLNLLVSKTFNRKLCKAVDKHSVFAFMIPSQFFRIEDNIRASDFKSRI